MSEVEFETRANLRPGADDCRGLRFGSASAGRRSARVLSLAGRADSAAALLRVSLARLRADGERSGPRLKSGWTTGGKRGPALIPEKPEESLLIRAVEHRDPDLKMPEEKLAQAEIDVLIKWVRQGAFDDRVAAPKGQINDDWWSLKPLVAPAVPGEPTLHPVDAFIGAKLAESGLSASSEATPRELIRRLYFDLTGLPPAPDDVVRFEADPSEAAYLQLVDQLLASPRYGSGGLVTGSTRSTLQTRTATSTMWGAIMPAVSRLCDRGPEHRPPLGNVHPPTAGGRSVRAGVRSFDSCPGIPGAGTFDYSTYATGPVTFDYLDRDDMLTQTMAAFVSTTANCARCHAHKFDPIAQEDYYALQAVFSGIVKGDIRYDADPRVHAERSRLKHLLEAAQRGDAAQLQSELSQSLVANWTSERGKGADWKPSVCSRTSPPRGPHSHAKRMTGFWRVARLRNETTMS